MLFLIISCMMYTSQVFLPCAWRFLLSSVRKWCMKAIRHIINWYWFISLPLQTDDTLNEALSHLVAFDIDKIVFAKVDCLLALPKLHSLQHYDDKIKSFDTPDNLDTKYTEN